MLRKHVTKFQGQWDRFLPGVLWAYRNTPHEATKEKPSFLLFGIDLKSPTEASLFPPDPLSPTDLGSYREELILSLSTARELAVASIREAQKGYKAQYDKRAKPVDFQLGEWVFVRFPEEESGKRRKLSRPWYGPFRVVTKQDPNLTVQKVYFPEDPVLTVHQLRVCRSPEMLPAGFYWYGAKRRSSGRAPGWLQRMLNTAATNRLDQCDQQSTTAGVSDSQNTLSPMADGTSTEGDDCLPFGEDGNTEMLQTQQEALVEHAEEQIGDNTGSTLCTQTPTPNVGHNSEGSAQQQEHLDHLLALPYAVPAPTPLSIPHYSLRDRSHW